MTTTTRRETDRVEVERAAADAFVFGYPLVLMDRMRGDAPSGAFVHERPLEGRGPEPDTLASSAWLDLREAPTVLSVPDAHGHYYVLSLIDMWTNVFASIGPRTTGTIAGRFAIGGPRFNGDLLPTGVLPITAPTDTIRVAGHTRLESGGAAGSAWALQDSFRLAPLSGRPAPAHHGAGVPAREAGAQLDALGAEAFLRELARLLDTYPPPRADRPLVERLRAIGVLPRPGGVPTAHPGLLERGVEQARARIRAAARPLVAHVPGRWHIRDRSGPGSDHIGRAAAAYAGLHTTSADDVVTASVSEDRRGEPLTGEARYELRFDADRTPPAHGFWSLAVHDGASCVARLGSGDGLTLGVDGSLTIHVQPRPPVAREQRSNWLAAPGGAFRLVLALWWPTGDVLTRRWTPPGVTRVA